MSAEDDAYYKKMIDDLFEGQADTDVLTAKSVKITAKKLVKALEEGMGKKLSEVDYNTPDDGVYKAMEKNVYEFSQAKNHTQMKALNEALYDGKRLRTYEEFKREAFVILDGNLTHLKAEYNHAVAAAQAARKWAEFPEGAMLKYITVGDERVRASHELLDGIIAKKESDFWKTYFIPLDWGCRCNVIEVTDEEETDLSTRELPDIPSIFRPNVGVYGQVYSKKSNVFKGIPPRELEKAVYSMPLEHQFEVLKKGVKGKVLKIHHVAKTQDENKDLKGKIEAGEIIVNLGKSVTILPEINEHEAELRKVHFQNMNSDFNPDYNIEGKNGDYKKPLSYNSDKLKKLLKNSAAKDCEIPVIDYRDLDEALISKTNILKSCRKKVNGKGKISSIIVLFKDGTTEVIE